VASESCRASHQFEGLQNDALVGDPRILATYSRHETSVTGRSLSGDFAFGRFVVQSETHRFLVDGEPTKLGARAFDVLLALIERRDRVVTKNELLGWRAGIPPRRARATR